MLLLQKLLSHLLRLFFLILLFLLELLLSLLSFLLLDHLSHGSSLLLFDHLYLHYGFIKVDGLLVLQNFFISVVLACDTLLNVIGNA